MKLSILIPTLHKRSEMYEKLYLFIADQLTDGVEILSEVDHGEMKVGKKRQSLLDSAMGDYICFVDDDDMVSDDYVAKILNAVKSKPDCCSLTGNIHFKNGTTKVFEHSIEYETWYEKDNIYYRYPNHLNAVRRDLALKVGFKDMGHGEDRDYSDRLRPLLRVEEHIEGVIYHYNCHSNG